MSKNKANRLSAFSPELIEAGAAAMTFNHFIIELMETDEPVGEALESGLSRKNKATRDFFNAQKGLYKNHSGTINPEHAIRFGDLAVEACFNGMSYRDGLSIMDNFQSEYKGDGELIATLDRHQGKRLAVAFIQPETSTPSP